MSAAKKKRITKPNFSRKNNVHKYPNNFSAFPFLPSRRYNRYYNTNDPLENSSTFRRKYIPVFHSRGPWFRANFSNNRHEYITSEQNIVPENSASSPILFRIIHVKSRGLVESLTPRRIPSGNGEGAMHDECWTNGVLRGGERSAESSPTSVVGQRRR